MPIIKSTQMIEDTSTVNAREFGEARDETTILLALDAIGSLYRNLLLTDEEDGLWTLHTNVTIPGNVTVVVPLGVTIAGPGNLTILGGIWGMRSPIHAGPGALILTNANNNLGPVMNAANIDFIYNRLFVGQDLYLTNSIRAGSLGSVPVPAPPWPPEAPGQAPIWDYDWAAHFYNTDDITAIKSQSGALYGVNRIRLTSDSHNETGAYGGGFTSQVFCNGYQMWAIRGAESYAVAWGGGGVKYMEAIASICGLFENTTCEQMTNVNIYGPYRWGNIQTYHSLYVGGSDLHDPWQGPGTIQTAYNIVSAQNLGPAGTTRYNLYSLGTAPNYIQAAVSIGALVEQEPTYLLRVWGAAQKPGGGSWTDASSATLKRNIRPLTGALDTLCQLEGKWFEWAEPEHLRVLPGLQVGLLAENVRDVVPQWVEEAPNGDLLVTTRGELAYIAEAFREVRARLIALEGK